MAQVVIDNLGKTFKGPKGAAVHAVRNAHLTVADGELLALVGPSGCGKSTTLRLIAGLEEPSSGSVSLNGQVLDRVLPKDRDIAMVFQNHALYPHMTARENLAFGLKLRHHDRAEIEGRVTTAAELLNLKDCLDRKPAELSGGQRQRVAVGRAIVLQPKLFLFDEPLSNLDTPMRVQLRRELSRLHTRLRATMIYVTHDQVEAMTLGDRIAVMRDGVIQQVAEPMTLYRRPANLFVAGFIGSPAMNIFHGTLMKEGGGVYFLEQPSPNESQPNAPRAPTLKVRLPDAAAVNLAAQVGQKIALGLRPEDITDRPPTANSPAVSAIAEVLEPLGAETYLYAATGGHPVVARVFSARLFSPGQPVALAFDLARAHYFDPATEKAIVA